MESLVYTEMSRLNMTLGDFLLASKGNYFERFRAIVLVKNDNFCSILITFRPNLVQTYFAFFSFQFNVFFCCDSSFSPSLATLWPLIYTDMKYFLLESADVKSSFKKKCNLIS